MNTLSAKPSERERIVGIVLAGGRSRRMGGGDKSGLALGRSSMLELVVDRLRPQVGALALNANGNPSRLVHLNLPIVADGEFSFAGPLAGILAGVRWARRNSSSVEWLATVATDSPFFPPNLVHGLLNASERPEVARVAASRGRTHPVFGLWPIDLAAELADWLAKCGSRRVRDWVEHIPHVVVNFEETDGPDPFFNVNTPEDASEARLLMAETV